MRKRRVGFTLVELMVVTTLLGVAAAVVSLSMAGVSEREAARSAVLQLRTLYRLAQVEAAHTGRPCSLSCDAGGCVLMRLVWRQDGWDWREGASARMPSGIRLAAVEGVGGSGEGASWAVAVSSGGWNGPVRCTLRGRSGAAVTARIDTFGRDASGP